MRAQGLIFQTEAKCVLLVARLLGRGVEVAITSGFRSCADQDALFAKGRTAPGHIVTKARGGDSFHNCARAADFVLDDKPGDGVKPCWNPNDRRWQILGEVAEELGLAWGGNFGKVPGSGWDKPHVEDRYCETCGREHGSAEQKTMTPPAGTRLVPLARTFNEDGSCAMPRDGGTA